ncbi:hypothetical protein D3OALGA1CA_3605 [Olavius algarvensis associated proteobacterium Delta 3]|nr:hypothetical protein D3OALGA1CA_3605 [Olavius algarvensis associated proteobacterium Delta 3]CAB5146993.1 hypothetical protein D3OALGB2SA_4566 [Olavius algarvensis associated proteobacterium Delta 3]
MRLRPSRKSYLLFEFTAVFFGLPGIFAAGWIPIYSIPLLILFSLICLLILIRDPGFDNRRLVRLGAWKQLVRPMLIRLLLGCLLIGGATVAFRPELLFGFPKSHPVIYMFFLLLYPMLSVYPQGVTHRAFLLHRYRPLFPGYWGAIVVSAAAFSFMHIAFQNPVALVLTFIGGILFAKTYLDSGSLVLSVLEHALYGIFVFTIGLGRYLYLGRFG